MKGSRKKYRYTFIKKIEPKARESVGMAIVSLVFYVLAIILSFGFKGNAGLYVGGLGMAGMLTAFYGFYLGMKALSREGMYRYTAMGTICAGIMSIIWLGTLVLGIG